MPLQFEGYPKKDLTRRRIARGIARVQAGFLRSVVLRTRIAPGVGDVVSVFVGTAGDGVNHLGIAVVQHVAGVQREGGTGVALFAGAQGVGPLQGSELISDARTEKENLLTELKEMLNEVSRKSQLERKQQEAQFARETMQNIPTTIYIM